MLVPRTTRVHSTTEVSRGSPDATPCGKLNVPAGYGDVPPSGPGGFAPMSSPHPGMPTRVAPTTNQPVRSKNSRRFMDDEHIGCRPSPRDVRAANVTKFAVGDAASCPDPAQRRPDPGSAPEARQPGRSLAAPDRPGARPVGELLAAARGAQQQPAAAHVAAPDEGLGEHQAIGEHLEQRIDVLAGR